METRNIFKKMSAVVLTGFVLMTFSASTFGGTTPTFCLYNIYDCPSNQTTPDQTCPSLQLRCHLSSFQIPCLHNLLDCPATQGGKTAYAPTCSTTSSCTFSP